MNKTKLAAYGIGACAAACAASLAVPALLGAGVLGLGGAASLLAGVGVETVVCLVGALAITGVVFVLLKRKAWTNSCAADGACGCNSGASDAFGRS